MTPRASTEDCACVLPHAKHVLLLEATAQVPKLRVRAGVWYAEAPKYSL